MAKKKSGKSAAKRREDMLQLIREMVSEKQADVIDDQIGRDNFGAAYLETSMDMTYGEVWPREGLTRKERSLVTLGVLIALRAPVELDYQIRMALKNGVTPRELEEVLLHTFPYLGVTPVSHAQVIAIKILNELGYKTQNRSKDD